MTLILRDIHGRYSNVFYADFEQVLPHAYLQRQRSSNLSKCKIELLIFQITRSKPLMSSSRMTLLFKVCFFINNFPGSVNNEIMIS